ncbi:hypothetical protein M0804_013247 [Polistes exclamans]|nr:hypothetical protein M0804_013247 [Polistes exclamans]
MNGLTELAKLGRNYIKCFNPKTMDFLKWLNNFEYLVTFLHIPNNRKVEFLLQLMEPRIFTQIQQKVEPANPLFLPYVVLISHLEQLYGPYQGEWAANYRFLARNQFIGESAIQFVIALKRIANDISFSLRNDTNLMVRFINGLKDEDIKNILRYSTKLTLDRAVVIAAQLEKDKMLAKSGETRNK